MLQPRNMRIPMANFKIEIVLAVARRRRLLQIDATQGLPHEQQPQNRNTKPEPFPGVSLSGICRLHLSPASHR